MHLRYAVITDNQVLARSMRRFFRVTHGLNGVAIDLPAAPPQRRLEYRKEWDVLTQWLDGMFGAEPAEMRGLICFVSLCDWRPESMRFIDEWKPERARSFTVGKLVLAYPEVDWVFLHQLFGDDRSQNRGDTSREKFAARRYLGSGISIEEAERKICAKQGKPGEDGRVSILRNSGRGLGRIFRRDAKIMVSWRPECAPGPHRAIDDVVQQKRMGLSPLFDGDGLRAVLCNRIRAFTSGGIKHPAAHIRDRDRYALAIEEELAYAYLGAYVAYRTGYRTHIATSCHNMEAYLKKEATQKPDLCLEDVFLNFEDKKPDASFSRLGERTGQYPVLGRVPLRLIFTYGDTSGADQEIFEDNVNTIEMQNLPLDDNDAQVARWWRARLRRRRQSISRHASIHRKPFAGVYDLKAQIETGHRHLAKNPIVTGYPINTANSWPPSLGGACGANSGHSAPGALLAVADVLIARAQLLIGTVRSTEDAVHGAVLSMTALEMLGGLTPTSSLEALSLMHRFEVIAECRFFGIGTAYDVGKRIADIKVGAEWIAQYFDRRGRSARALESEELIISEIVKIYREYNQFDEEIQCLYHNRYVVAMKRLKCARAWPIWMLPAWIWAWARWFFTGYANYITRSTLRFMCVLVGAPLMLAGLTIIFPVLRSWAFVAGGTAQIGASAGDLLASRTMKMYALFYGGAPPSGDLTSAGHIVVSAIMIFSLANVGLFVSHLYSKFLRR